MIISFKSILYKNKKGKYTQKFIVSAYSTLHANNLALSKFGSNWKGSNYFVNEVGGIINSTVVLYKKKKK